MLENLIKFLNKIFYLLSIKIQIVSDTYVSVSKQIIVAQPSFFKLIENQTFN